MDNGFIRVEIKDEGVRKMFAELRAAATNMTPLMKVIGEIIRSSVIRNFETGGRPDKWRRHSPKTRRITGDRVLINTARLMKSISAKAYPDRAEIGTNVVYGRIHQLGGMAGRNRKVRIPARPYLMVQDEDWPEIRSAAARHITGRNA